MRWFSLPGWMLVSGRWWFPRHLVVFLCCLSKSEMVRLKSHEVEERGVPEEPCSKKSTCFRPIKLNAQSHQKLLAYASAGRLGLLHSSREADI